MSSSAQALDALMRKVVRLSREIMGRDKDDCDGSSRMEDRRFRQLFGCGLAVVLSIWALLMDNDLYEGADVQHLLWALVFMKVYSNEAALCSLVGGVDEKTFRKWVWKMIFSISCLEFIVIDWDARLIDDIGNDALITVDGTDFMVPEEGKAFYSHKFKKSGLRYEVGVCIRTGDIVWIHGPFPCGSYNDIMIFRHALKDHLGPGERVEADDGYLGEAPEYVKCPKCISNPRQNRQKQKRVRSRQETVNKRFKQWGCLKQVFRHDIVDQHADVFRAVVVITQLCINSGEPLFAVVYDHETPNVPYFAPP